MPTRNNTSLPYLDYPACAGSFDSSRQPIDKIVIHTMDGTFEGTKAWFQNTNREKLTSAHYGISLDGRIALYVPESKTAYHAGNYLVNQQSIGIEHEDAGKPNEPRTDQLYQTSAMLVADICLFYSIPIDRQHILKHSEVTKTSTECPDTLDIDRIVKTALELSKTTPVNNTQPTTPNAVKTVSVAVPIFDMLVTKSANFDDACEPFEFSDEQKTHPGAGKLLAENIRQIIQDKVALNKKIDELESNQVVQTTNTSNQSNIAFSDGSNPITATSTQTIGVPDNSNIIKDAGHSAKNQSLNGLIEVFHQIVNYFWS